MTFKIYIKLPCPIKNENQIKSLHPRIDKVILAGKECSYCYLVFKDKREWKQISNELSKIKIDGRNLFIRNADKQDMKSTNYELRMNKKYPFNIFLRFDKPIKHVKEVKKLHPDIENVILPKFRGSFCNIVFEDAAKRDFVYSKIKDIKINGKEILIRKSITKESSRNVDTSVSNHKDTNALKEGTGCTENQIDNCEQNNQCGKKNVNSNHAVKTQSQKAPTIMNACKGSNHPVEKKPQDDHEQPVITTTFKPILKIPTESEKIETNSKNLIRKKKKSKKTSYKHKINSEHPFNIFVRLNKPIKDINKIKGLHPDIENIILPRPNATFCNIVFEDAAKRDLVYSQIKNKKVDGKKICLKKSINKELLHNVDTSISNSNDKDDIIPKEGLGCTENQIDDHAPNNILDQKIKDIGDSKSNDNKENFHFNIDLKTVKKESQQDSIYNDIFERCNTSIDIDDLVKKQRQGSADAMSSSEELIDINHPVKKEPQTSHEPPDNIPTFQSLYFASHDVKPTLTEKNISNEIRKSNSTNEFTTIKKEPETKRLQSEITSDTPTKRAKLNESRINNQEEAMRKVNSTNQYVTVQKDLEIEPVQQSESKLNENMNTPTRSFMGWDQSIFTIDTVGSSEDCTDQIKYNILFSGRDIERLAPPENDTGLQKGNNNVIDKSSCAPVAQNQIDTQRSTEKSIRNQKRSNILSIEHENNKNFKPNSSSKLPIKTYYEDHELINYPRPDIEYVMYSKLNKLGLMRNKTTRKERTGKTQKHDIKIDTKGSLEEATNNQIKYTLFNNQETRPPITTKFMSSKSPNCRYFVETNL